MHLSEKKIMYILLKHFLKHIRTKMLLRHKENFCTDRNLDHNSFKAVLESACFLNQHESARFLKGMRIKQTHHFPLCTQQSK